MSFHNVRRVPKENEENFRHFSLSFYRNELKVCRATRRIDKLKKFVSLKNRKLSLENHLKRRIEIFFASRGQNQNQTKPNQNKTKQALLNILREKKTTRTHTQNDSLVKVEKENLRFFNVYFVRRTKRRRYLEPFVDRHRLNEHMRH